MRILAVTPLFAPDGPPTATAATQLANGLGALGHQVDVVTSLPWYRLHAVEPEWRGRPARRERTPWGSITRVHPFPTTDKLNIRKRSAGFAAYCAAVSAVASAGRPVDVVLAMSPPLPMAATGWLASLARRAPLVLNIQDVFPDIVIKLGLLKNPRLIEASRALERWSYARSAAVTVLGDGVRESLTPRVRDASKLHVIPNVVDVDSVQPGPLENAYREEFGLSGKTVVMYAGNVGMSQPLELMVDAARANVHRTDVVFVISGNGSLVPHLKAISAGLPNVKFVPTQPYERLPEILRAGDIHVVPLKAGLANCSIPHKTTLTFAVGRPVIASVDTSSDTTRVVESSGGGIAVPPEDPASFRGAVETLLDDVDKREEMGRAARKFVETTMSPRDVALRYEALFDDVRVSRARRRLRRAR